MLKIESKIGTVRRSTDELFALLSNFENIVSFVPKDQVQDLVVEKERCTFTVQGQKMEIIIIDKEINNYIKFGSGEISPVTFFFWIQMKATEAYVTKIKLTMHLDIPLLAQPFIKGKLEKALNEMMDKISVM
ncbi:MAG TPA: hypothetical protein PLP65_05120 [Bacteroidales bacterium]|nr:hypothetical protein [Bacteroidales bacterium]HOU98210.1 hypothetical protein [Bacteroidales bacterium]